MNSELSLGLALACLAICFIILAVLSWRQEDKIKSLEKRIKKVEDDRAESKGSVLYTRPIHVVPSDNYGVPVSRRERRRAGLMDGAGTGEVPPGNPPDADMGVRE